MPTPSVGRIVHYLSRGSQDHVYEPELRAAIITNVNSFDNVDLCVLNPSGLFFPLFCDQGSLPGQWQWPERVD